MDQKGFILIIFVVIGVLVGASITLGMVKYKDEITANISKVFKKSEIEIDKFEPIEPKKEINQLLQKSLIQQKAMIGEIVKPVVKPTEETPQQSSYQPQPQSIQQPVQSDPSIKIELCKNEASQQRAEFISILEKRLKKQVESSLQKHKDELKECFARADAIEDEFKDVHILPSEVSKLVLERTNQCVAIFNVQKDYYNQQYQSMMSKYYDEADKLYRRVLNECLSK